MFLHTSISSCILVINPSSNYIWTGSTGFLGGVSIITVAKGSGGGGGAIVTIGDNNLNEAILC